MTFFLLKAGVPHPVQRLSPEGDVANFTLPSVKAEDAGSYSCICSVGERSSSPSDALHLEVERTHIPPSQAPTPLSLLQPAVSLSSSSSSSSWSFFAVVTPSTEITYAEASKELQTEPWASESEEPQGVTYTQLSLAALQTGQRAPTATCPEPSVYSTLALH